MNFSRAPPCSPCLCKSLSLFIVSPHHLRVRTASGPGSPSGQPAWGGGCDRVILEFQVVLMTRSLPLAVLTLLLHSVVKLIREFRIESLKNRKLARHAIFVVERGINQPETI